MVEAAKDPGYLRSIGEAVAAFQAALVDLLQLYVAWTGPGRGMAPAVVMRDDADPSEASRRRSVVARAAGRAAAAPSLTDCYIEVVGFGPIDPIAAWQSMTQPKPLLEPDNVLDACDQMLGRLDGLAAKAEVEAPPRYGVEAMHPLVWGAARRLWEDGHFRQAVVAAADTLADSVKRRTGRNDVAETSLWDQTFSERDPSPGRPRLRWPGDPSDQHVRNMNEGLRRLAPGVQMTVRNTATHVLDEMPVQDALERLGVLSLLAHWVEACRLESVDDPGATPR